MRELLAVVGHDAVLEVLASQPPVVTDPDTPLFHHLAETLRARDPLAIPIPTMIPGFTDAKAWSRLGIQWYGFSPVKLEPGLSFAAMYHGKDERIPVEGLAVGSADVVRSRERIRLRGLASGSAQGQPDRQAHVRVVRSVT